MNSLSVYQAIEIAAKSFDRVLKKKTLVLALIGISAVIALFVTFSSLYYPQSAIGIHYLVPSLLSALMSALLMIYAKNEFEGKSLAITSTIYNFVQRIGHIAPAVVLIGLFDAFFPSGVMGSAMIPSMLIQVASFIFSTLGLYLLSMAIIHHGSFLSAVRQWLNHLPSMAPSALIGRVMFVLFAALIGFVVVALGALLVQIKSWIMPSQALLPQSPLFFFSAFFLTALFGLWILAAQSYFFATLGWFSVHNKLPEQFK